MGRDSQSEDCANLDAESGEPAGQALRHDNEIDEASFSADGCRILTVSRDNTLCIWDVPSGERVGKPLRHANHIRKASFSPDGRRILTAVDYENTARLWDALSGEPIGAPLELEQVVGSSSFSWCGRRIVTASGKTARVWDSENAKLVGELRHETAIFAANFSPDGRRIVTISYDNIARPWDAENGKLLCELRHEKGISAANFSPEATGGGSLLFLRITPHECGMRKTAGYSANCAMKTRYLRRILPDERRIVTASSDKTARVWDAANGKLLGETLRHEHGVMDANFSPDGRQIATFSMDSSGWVFTLAAMECREW